jgi:hypothetical protein
MGIGDVEERLISQGAEPRSSAPEEAAYIKQDVPKTKGFNYPRWG